MVSLIGFQYRKVFNYKILTCIVGVLLLMDYHIASAQQDQKLYISMVDIGPSAQLFFDKNNIEHVYTFDNRYYDQNNDLHINTDKLKAAIIKQFPDRLSNGIAVLDYEGNALKYLRMSAQTPEFKNALNTYLNLIKFAKSVRPNVKWGFYGLPFTTYWKRDSNWRQSCDNIVKLLQQCDILFPTFYVAYKDGSIGKDDNEDFARENILVALKLANKMNKPVLPFIWNRYHISNKVIGLELIPVDEFKKYLNTILSTSYNGYKVAGLVWWDEDKYDYNVKSRALMSEVSQSNEKNFKDYHDKLVINYGNNILSVISQKK